MSYSYNDAHQTHHAVSSSSSYPSNHLRYRSQPPPPYSSRFGELLDEEVDDEEDDDEDFNEEFSEEYRGIEDEDQTEGLQRFRGAAMLPYRSSDIDHEVLLDDVYSRNVDTLGDSESTNHHKGFHRLSIGTSDILAIGDYNESSSDSNAPHPESRPPSIAPISLSSSLFDSPNHNSIHLSPHGYPYHYRHEYADLSSHHRSDFSSLANSVRSSRNSNLAHRNEGETDEGRFVNHNDEIPESSTHQDFPISANSAFHASRHLLQTPSIHIPTPLPAPTLESVIPPEAETVSVNSAPYQGTSFAVSPHTTFSERPHRRRSIEASTRLSRSELQPDTRNPELLPNKTNSSLSLLNKRVSQSSIPSDPYSNGDVNRIAKSSVHFRDVSRNHKLNITTESSSSTSESFDDRRIPNSISDLLRDWGIPRPSIELPSTSSLNPTIARNENQTPPLSPSVPTIPPIISRSVSTQTQLPAPNSSSHSSNAQQSANSPTTIKASQHSSGTQQSPLIFTNANSSIKGNSTELQSLNHKIQQLTSDYYQPVSTSRAPNTVNVGTGFHSDEFIKAADMPNLDDTSSTLQMISDVEEMINRVQISTKLSTKSPARSNSINSTPYTTAISSPHSPFTSLLKSSREQIHVHDRPLSAASASTTLSETIHQIASAISTSPSPPTPTLQVNANYSNIKMKSQNADRKAIPEKQTQRTNNVRSHSPKDSSKYAPSAGRIDFNMTEQEKCILKSLSTIEEELTNNKSKRITKELRLSNFSSQAKKKNISEDRDASAALRRYSNGDVPTNRSNHPSKDKRKGKSTESNKHLNPSAKAIVPKNQNISRWKSKKGPVPPYQSPTAFVSLAPLQRSRPKLSNIAMPVIQDFDENAARILLKQGEMLAMRSRAPHDCGGMVDMKPDMDSTLSHNLSLLSSDDEVEVIPIPTSVTALDKILKAGRRISFV